MPPEPRFFLTSREVEHPLCEGEHVVGRTAHSDVQVASEQVSRRHARLRVTADFFYLEDLGSLNGTFVNGVRSTHEEILLPGDRVRFGDREFVVRSALQPNQHEIRTPITSGYARLPDLHLPTVIVRDVEDDEDTVPSPDGPAPPAVLLGLDDLALAGTIVREADERGVKLPVRLVALNDLYGELGQAGGGGLVLDVDALGTIVSDLVKAWRGPRRRKDPVVLVGRLDEDEGEDVAASSGADAFVEVGGERGAAEAAALILEALGLG